MAKTAVGMSEPLHQAARGRRSDQKRASWGTRAEGGLGQLGQCRGGSDIPKAAVGQGTPSPGQWRPAERPQYVPRGSANWRRLVMCEGREGRDSCPGAASELADLSGLQKSGPADAHVALGSSSTMADLRGRRGSIPAWRGVEVDSRRELDGLLSCHRPG